MAEYEPEVERDFVVIFPGLKSCSRYPNEQVKITAPVYSKNNQKVVRLANEAEGIVKACAAESGCASCLLSCSVDELKNRADFYIKQNETDLRATKD